MRRYVLALSIIFVLLLNTIHAKNMKEEMDKSGYPCRVGLISFPKSGTNWLQYCMIQISGRFWTKNNMPFSNFGIEQTEPPSLLHGHHVTEFQWFDRSKDKLIIIVRNYKESLIRYRGIAKIDHIIASLGTEDVANFRKGCIKEGEWYLQNLLFFDTWNENNRLLIYYEDLIENPYETLTSLAAFLEVGPEKVDQFFSNYEKHRQTMIDYYNRYYDVSNTSGMHAIYHSNKLSKEKQIFFDKQMISIYPYLCEKYLSRYITKEAYDDKPL